MPRLLSRAFSILRLASRAARGSRFTVLAAIVLSGLARPAFAQAIDANLWIANGPVNAVAYSGGTVYIGGEFSKVGPATGCGVPLNGSGGFAPSFPKVAGGSVYAVAPDGSGGWYIGGTFSLVGGLTRFNLAHIHSDMTVDAWNPAPNGGVTALLVDGPKLYVGGAFTTIGGQNRNRIAAVDAATGVVTSWDPSANDGVNCLKMGGSVLYVGGKFTSIGGQTRNYIAALNVTTGAATAWDPNANAQVWTMEVGGVGVFVGGFFTQVGGQSRNFLAALDPTTGTAMTWNPAPNGAVLDLEPSGSLLYVGGQFSLIGGQSKPWLAAVDASTAAVSSWSSAADGTVTSLSFLGSTLYAGGYFTHMGGQPRDGLAAVDVTSGIATSWNPSPDALVQTIDASGPFIYVGGDFQSMGGVARNNLAALSASTGAALSWNPNANSAVHALVVDGSTVYVGGDFTMIGVDFRDRLAAINASTGAVSPSWDPIANNTVQSLAVNGSTIYVAGSFTQIDGVTRNRLAAISSGGALLSWDPNADGSVYAITVDAVNGKVYAGGTFTNIGPAPRSYVAQINPITGNATSWNAFANSTVRALAISGQKIYAGGFFTNIGFRPANYLAALDSTTALAASSWDPNPNGSVTALVATSTLLYVSGQFSLIAGQGRSYIASLNLWPGTASATPWNPGLASPPVASLAMSDATVYVGGSFLAIGGKPQARIAAVDAGPEVTSVYPFMGGNAGSITSTVFGRAFRNGATVKLVASGKPDIVGTQVAVAQGGATLTATFDLTGQAAGVRDAVVTNPDLVSSVPLVAFLVQEVAAPQLRVSVLGPEPIRAGYPTAFDLVIENPGNVDALAVPLWVTGIPLAATVTPDFVVSPPPQAGGEPGWGGVPLTFTSANGQYLPLVIPRVPPGTVTRRITLNVPSSVPVFQLGVAVAPPWGNDPVLGSCLSAGGITNPSCMGTQLGAINSYLATHPEVEAMSGTGIWAKVAWQCEGAGSLAAAIAKSEQVLDHLAGAIEQGTAEPGCRDALLARWREVVTVNVVFAIDPNDKLGPTGPVSSQQSIPYSIRFENLSSSTAWARQVTVVDALSTSLDLNSLSLDAIHLFGTVHLLPAPGSKQYTRDVDLGHDNLLVRITASLDVPSRQVTWSLATLDKTTLQPPSNPLLGFLPPNQTPPQGEGSMLFTIRPASSTPNGTMIQNTAVISFDGAPLTTPAVNNTLDNAPPSSNVLPLGTPISDPSFAVSWTGSSSGDLRDYTIYVKEDNAPYQVWKQNTQSTSDTFTPQPGGHSYAFYSVARDLSGNIEPAPSSPDAQTYSTVAVGEVEGSGLTLLGGQPNPARGVLRVGFTLASRERATLELIDIAGRRVLRREVGELGAGSHVVMLGSFPRLQSGVYFLRLVQADHALEARVVLMR